MAKAKKVKKVIKKRVKPIKVKEEVIKVETEKSGEEDESIEIDNKPDLPEPKQESISELVVIPSSPSSSTPPTPPTHQQSMSYGQNP